MNPLYPSSAHESKAAAHANEEKLLCGGLFVRDRDIDLTVVRPFFEKAYMYKEPMAADSQIFDNRIERNCFSYDSLFEEALNLMIRLGNVDLIEGKALLNSFTEMTPAQRYRGLKLITDNKGIIHELMIEEDWSSYSFSEYIRAKVIAPSKKLSGGKVETSLESKNSYPNEGKKALAVIISLACFLIAILLIFL